MLSFVKNARAVIGIALLTACFTKPKFNGSDDANSVDAFVPPESAIDPRGPQRLSAGANHVCSIDNAGHLLCWGDNSQAQLGVGNTAVIEVPTQVGLDTGWTAISAGLRHSCGIRDAVAYCWGNNERNQVGGSGLVVVDPRAVGFAFNDFVVENIFALDDASCATGTRGGSPQLYCWGAVEPGGSVLVSNATASIQISNNPTTTKWTKVSGARGHRCALRDDGAAYCWGENSDGQVGSGVMAPGPNVVRLQDAARIGNSLYLDIATGQNSSCAVTVDHRLQCWGAPNENIAPTTPQDFHLPREVLPAAPAPPSFRSVAIGLYYACATNLAGEVACFGTDEDGAMGFELNLQEGFNQNSATPRPVRMLAAGPAPQAVTLVTGFDFACMRTVSGAPVLCWGAHDRGQLGIGNRARRTTPAAAVLSLPAAAKIQSIAAGAHHTCVSIRSNGIDTNSCWGANFDSQVTGNVTDNSSVMITMPTDPTSKNSALLVAGSDNTCSILPGADKIACWGKNSDGQLGPNFDNMMVGYSDLTPVSATNNRWTLVATNGNAACGVERGPAAGARETLQCWGLHFGQPSSAPTTIYSPVVIGVVAPQYDQLAMGAGFGMAVVRPGSALTGRKLMTWGSAEFFQLSPTPNTMTHDDLQNVLTIPDTATEISLAPANDGGHACISWVANDVSHVQCWGRNNQQQLGAINTSVQVATPMLPGDFITHKVVTAFDHSCALSRAGAIACWGSGYDLGLEGDLGARSRLFGVGTVWADLATGRDHVCAVNDERREVQCWGTSKFGEFGNGARYHPDPVAALVRR